MLNAKSEISLGRTIMLVIAKLGKEKVPLPFRNQEPWHLLFYTLKMESDASGRPNFLSELVFDWDGPSPKCEEVSEFLNGLHITANVSGLNPRFDLISVDDDDAIRWLQDFEQLDRDSKSFVLRAAEIARNEFVG